MNASLIPMAAKVFSEPEDALFEELVDEAEIEAIVDALFPEALLKTAK